MNSAPLSESSPRRGNGRIPADVHQRLVDPSLGLVAKGAWLGPPRCHADKIKRLAELAAGIAAVVGYRSTSQNPGRRSSHSAKVRMGIWRFRIEPGLVPERPRTCRRARSGASRRSMLAAEI